MPLATGPVLLALDSRVSSIFTAILPCIVLNRTTSFDHQVARFAFRTMNINQDILPSSHTVFAMEEGDVTWREKGNNSEKFPLLR